MKNQSLSRYPYQLTVQLENTDGIAVAMRKSNNSFRENWIEFKGHRPDSISSFVLTPSAQVLGLHALNPNQRIMEAHALVRFE